MSVKIIVGAQWGDEGKGKIVDLLSEQINDCKHQREPVFDPYDYNIYDHVDRSSHSLLFWRQCDT